MIIIEHNDLGRQHTRGLISSREFARELWRELCQQMPYLAGLEPTDVLADVADLPREVAEAYHYVTQRELAEMLLAEGDFGPDEQHLGPLRPGLALLLYRVADDGQPSYAGRIVGVGGRTIDGPGLFAGPWFTRRPHTLIALALDDAAGLDAIEAADRSRPTAPATPAAGLPWIPGKA